MNSPINETPAQRELREAMEAQRSHMAIMSNNFSSTNMNIFTELNERVRRAQVNVENETNVLPTSTTRATVRLVRAGKDEKVIEVDAGLSLRQVIEQAGWNPSEMSVQKRTGAGSSQDVDLDQPVGEGAFEYLCNPKYAAGA